MVAVESHQIWTADLETCGGLFRCGFVNLLWVLLEVWLVVGYFAVVVVGFCSTGGVGWWGLAPRWVGMAC